MRSNRKQGLSSALAVAVLTGGFDRPYVSGLAMSLIGRGVYLDVVGSNHLDTPEMHTTPRLNFLNLRGDKSAAGLWARVTRVLIYYARLIRYAALARPGIFHILWNNKFELIDRTILMLYYKLLGKKVVFTAHNVNAGKRDGTDSLFNRITLKTQYSLADHIFVHTGKMKRELERDFEIRSERITVIPFGINNSVRTTSLTSAEGRQQLGIGREEKVILFFGAIGRYKGLEYLTEAFLRLASRNREYRLIIAGHPKKGSEEYLRGIQHRIDRDVLRGRVIQNIQYIPDEETELYFKAADVLALPYTEVFQSGVLFLAYGFGLPVIATDVGSIREDMIDGTTGFLCAPRDAAAIAAAIERYFASDLYRNLESRRQQIRDYAQERHSWDIVGEMTRNVYAGLGR